MIETLAAAAGRSVSRETFEQIRRYEALLREESQRHNLVARSTLSSLWDRHIIDSAQLVRFQRSPADSWVDIGTGAGLPGLVIAILVEGPVLLVEPRRLRADFLSRAVGDLGLEARVKVASTKAERVEGQFDVVTARAVAPLGRLFEITAHLSHPRTILVLPKGQSAKSELAEARRTWQGRFHVEQSVTDDDSHIIVGTGVKPKR